MHLIRNRDLGLFTRHYLLFNDENIKRIIPVKIKKLNGKQTLHTLGSLIDGQGFLYRDENHVKVKRLGNFTCLNLDTNKIRSLICKTEVKPITLEVYEIN
jgi:hypothetical protein